MDAQTRTPVDTGRHAVSSQAGRLWVLPAIRPLPRLASLKPTPEKKEPSMLPLTRRLKACAPPVRLLLLSEMLGLLASAVGQVALARGVARSGGGGGPAHPG